MARKRNFWTFQACQISQQASSEDEESFLFDSDCGREYGGREAAEAASAALARAGRQRHTGRDHSTATRVGGEPTLAHAGYELQATANEL